MPARVRGLEAGVPSVDRQVARARWHQSVQRPPPLAWPAPPPAASTPAAPPCAPGPCPILTSLCNLWPAHGIPPPRPAVPHLLPVARPQSPIDTSIDDVRSSTHHTISHPNHSAHHLAPRLPSFADPPLPCSTVQPHRLALNVRSPDRPPSFARLICPACCCLLLARLS